MTRVISTLQLQLTGSTSSDILRNRSAFAEGLAAWLTQRGKGEGQPVQVEASRV
jgi:hypothetical protein